MINMPYPVQIPIQPIAMSPPAGTASQTAPADLGLSRVPSSREAAASRSAYRHAAVETATPERLLLMLYNGALRFLNKGAQALRDDNPAEANEALTRALDIIAELNVTLNMEAGGEIALSLRDLYNFYGHEVLLANIRRDPDRLEPVIGFFEDFRKVWTEAASSLRSPAVTPEQSGEEENG